MLTFAFARSHRTQGSSLAARDGLIINQGEWRLGEKKGAMGMEMKLGLARNVRQKGKMGMKDSGWVFIATRNFEHTKGCDPFSRGRCIGDATKVVGVQAGNEATAFGRDREANPPVRMIEPGEACGLLFQSETKRRTVLVSFAMGLRWALHIVMNISPLDWRPTRYTHFFHD